MKLLREEKGITIVALIITVIVLTILASISIIEGTKLIEKSEVENIVTNMITIKAKAKIVAEEVNAEVGNLTDEEKQTKREDLYNENYKMKKGDISLISNEIRSNIDEEVTNGEYEYYQLTEETLEYMGLSNIKDTDNSNIAEIIIAKQRNGPTGTVQLVWLPEFTKFVNMEK